MDETVGSNVSMEGIVGSGLFPSAMNLLVPHLADKSRLGSLIVHTLTPGHRGWVTSSLLGMETLEQ